MKAWVQEVTKSIFAISKYDLLKTYLKSKLKINQFWNFTGTWISSVEIECHIKWLISLKVIHINT